jgi:ABC-type lipoprotein export system ATPase subunit
LSAVIRAGNITRSFGGMEVLKGLDITVGQGEFVAVTGRSGSGKSTLLGILGTLDRDFQGSLQVGGRDTAPLDSESLAALRRETMGFIFQDFHLLPNLSALENVLLPAVFSGRDMDPVEREAESLLTMLGVRMDSTPSRFLSRGERQRVAAARALAGRPQVLLADEPTASLDEASEDILFDLLDSMRREKGFALVAVVHTRSVLERADRVLDLREGVLHHEVVHA